MQPDNPKPKFRGVCSCSLERQSVQNTQSSPQIHATGNFSPNLEPCVGFCVLFYQIAYVVLQHSESTANICLLEAVMSVTNLCSCQKTIKNMSRHFARVHMVEADLKDKKAQDH